MPPHGYYQSVQQSERGEDRSSGKCVAKERIGGKCQEAEQTMRCKVETTICCFDERGLRYHGHFFPGEMKLSVIG